MQKTLLRLGLITMYKALVKPHLDYGDIIYDEAYNERFPPESLAYSMQCLLDLLRGIRGLSREKLYH